MASVTTEVTIDISEFSDRELIQEVLDRGLEGEINSAPDICLCDDGELIHEIEKRDYFVIDHDQMNRIEQLYTTYTTMSPEFFTKELKKFFSESLDIIVL